MNSIIRKLRVFLTMLAKACGHLPAPLPVIFVCCFLLGVTSMASATILDEELESDIDLDVETMPPEDKMEIPVLTVRAITGKPQIDGNIDDDFWKQAKSFELSYELYPERLAPATVKTEAFLAATKTHLYIAFKAHDPHPEGLRSALREHDASKEDDYVSIIIDPNGSGAKKFEFRVNPDGTLSDVLQDTISERYIYDWDTEWIGAAQKTDEGYTVEMAIPADAIHIPENDTTRNSKSLVILKRSYPRSVDTVFFTVFHINRPILKDSDRTESLSEVTILNPEDRDIPNLPGKLSLTAHGIYHLNEDRRIGGDYSQSEDTNEFSMGLDAEYKFSTSNIFALTIYPNFTDVEADIAKQSINNPFTVFRPEKRSFFRSVTEYYNSLIPVVYTRNVIQPRIGVSFFNDKGTDSYSGFASDDEKTEVIVPDNLGSDKVELVESSYSGAFRYRRSKDRHTYGIIGTYREGDGYHNATINYDGLFNFGPDDKFRYHISYADSKYPKNFAEDLCEEPGCTEEVLPRSCPLGECSVNPQVLRTNPGEQMNGHALQFRYKHDGPNGLYWAGYEQKSPDYRADLGFVRRVDLRSLSFAYGKKWYFKTLEEDEGKSRIRSYFVGNVTRSYEYDDLLDRSISFWGEFKGTYQSLFRAGYWFRERAVNRIDQASLDTGDNAPLFDENYLQWYSEASPFTNWKVNFDGRIGDVADSENMVLGYMLEFKPKLTYRYGPVELIASGTFRNFKLDGKSLYKEQFLSLTVSYRSSKVFSHRLQYIDDLTKRDTGRWIQDELAKEFERTFEYTLTYEPTESWKILFGSKIGYKYKSSLDDGDYTRQEVYCKIEKTF